MKRRWELCKRKREMGKEKKKKELLLVSFPLLSFQAPLSSSFTLLCYLPSLGLSLHLSLCPAKFP